jgi:hypothetical protein
MISICVISNHQNPTLYCRMQVSVCFVHIVIFCIFVCGSVGLGFLFLLQANMFPNIFICFVCVMTTIIVNATIVPYLIIG